jgi:phosphatidylserine/phosphatidylglycerophosphate/cardiolipin synthase-like enzyme/uncharacterized membrane protein YdjX (TVP38/TMEM64 family)
MADSGRRHETRAWVLDRPGVCWRRARARKAAPLIDGAAYFAALGEALERARRNVFVLGWDINADLVLDPARGSETLAELLGRLTAGRPDLEVRLLIWDWLLVYSLERQLRPARRFSMHAGDRVKLRLDSQHPPGGCHHEKVVVIDGQTAFVGGLDLTSGRWDTPEHKPHEPRRAVRTSDTSQPFHDVVLMVDGPVAAAIEQLACERWWVATGERVSPCPRSTDGHSPWPRSVPPWFRDVQVGIARTRPDWGRWSPAREIKQLYLAAIESAERTIYIESQYLTAGPIARRMAARMSARPTLESVIVTPARCESPVETAAMDVGRARFMRRLRRTAPERVRVLYPRVPGVDGEPVPINVHSKLLVIDDRLLCVGSANLCRRSLGLDTELCLAIEATPQDVDVRRSIRRFRDTLLAEHLEMPPEAVARAIAAEGERVVPVLNRVGGRLEELRLRLPGWLRLVASPARLADLDEPLTATKVAEHLASARRRREWLRQIVKMALLLALLVVLGVVAQSDALGLRPHVEAAFAFADRHETDPLGVVVVVLVFVLASLVLVPVTLLIAAAAAAMGPVIGFVSALLGTVAAAAVTFLIGRALGRERVRRLAGRRAVSVSHRLGRHEILAVALLRLVPLAPFTIVNIVAGVSEVRLAHFVIGSGLGLTPGIALTTVFGTQLGAWLRHPDPVGAVILLGALALLALGGYVLRWWNQSRLPV